jgi:putative oxidoreductase
MMKKIFSHAINLNLVHIWLLLFRILASAFMLTHGFPKFRKLLIGDFDFADPFGIGVVASLSMAVFSEFLCAILVIIGLVSRLATIPIIITMAVAAFVIHANDPFKTMELSLLYLIIFTTILILGPGKYSLDAEINKIKKRR